MRIDKWIELKRVKALCIALALVFGAEQVAWGMDPATFQLLLGSSEQQRQMDAARRAAVVTIYDDLYGRLPTTNELKEALDFLNRSPQLAHLVERLAESPESRWRLRQLNPERIAARKAEAGRISQAVSLMAGDFLRQLKERSGFRVQGSGQIPNTTVTSSPASETGGQEDGVSLREVDGMARRDGVGRDGLQGDQDVAEGGTVWADRPTAESRGVDRREHRR